VQQLQGDTGTRTAITRLTEDQLLVAERKRVLRTMGPGAWLLRLKSNFRGTARTAQRYMRLAQCVADVTFLQGMSLRQVYARLGIVQTCERGSWKISCGMPTPGRTSSLSWNAKSSPISDFAIRVLRGA
jgi:hypothetical protein